MDLWFGFVRDSDLHDDMMLVLGETDHLCDSFYLAHDSSSATFGYEGSRLALLVLFELWLDAIDALPDGERVYLPYDFQDEGTGWLRCTRSGAKVSVECGGSALEGWRLPPSEMGPLTRTLDDFEPGSQRLEGTLEALQAAVRASREDARARRIGPPVRSPIA